MKIAIVYQHYLDPGQPGGSRYNEFGKFWSDKGHQVTVITGSSNYATGQTPQHYLGRWVTNTHDGQVRVLRCYVPSTYAKSYLWRMWAYFGFTLSACTAALRVAEADVVIGSSPPLIVIFPAWFLSRLRNSPLVFEIRDLWPENAITLGVLRQGSALAKVLFAVERWACKTADKVNVLTPAFRENLMRRGLASNAKIVFVPNGADPSLFSPRPRMNEVRARYGWGDRFVVMYAGAMGLSNAAHQLLDAAEHLRHRSDILIAMVGDGADRVRLTAEAKARRLENIMFCGPQPKQDMPAFVNACDVGAAVLKKDPTFLTVYPNKVFDYMACERPTLLAIDGVARQLVCDEARAGVFAEPENGKAIADAIVKLAADPQACNQMGQRGRAWVLQNATREALAERYLTILQQLSTTKDSVKADWSY